MKIARLFALLLAICLLLTACGGGGQGSSAEESATNIDSSSQGVSEEKTNLNFEIAAFAVEDESSIYYIKSFHETEPFKEGICKRNKADKTDRILYEAPESNMITKLVLAEGKIYFVRLAPTDGSKLMSIDINTGTVVEELKNVTDYAFSEDTLYCISEDPYWEENAELYRYDRKTGSKKTLNLKGVQSLSYMDGELYFVKKSEGGLCSIFSLNVETEQVKSLPTEEKFKLIHSLYCQEGLVMFSGVSQTGTNGVYQFKVSSQRLTLKTDRSEFGFVDLPTNCAVCYISADEYYMVDTMEVNSATAENQKFMLSHIKDGKRTVLQETSRYPQRGAYVEKVGNELHLYKMFGGITGEEEIRLVLEVIPLF